MNKEQIYVYCVFFVSDETLEDELDAIFSTREKAEGHIRHMEQEDGGYELDFHIEEWKLR